MHVSRQDSASKGATMLTCAYCDLPCPPTREHVVPRWYSETPGEADTFSARAPVTHLRGDLVVKDVCRSCNSGTLATLDAYGKGLYERYFTAAAYAGEIVEFEYDYDRLVRWLLKLSFNSARAQNADVRVLREFRKCILGQSPLTDRIRCWLHLVAPTCFEVPHVARPARREERGQPDVFEPKWFRISQFRVPFNPATSFVQRQVLINSYAFTLLIAPMESAWPSNQFGELVEAYTNTLSAAKPIVRKQSRLELMAGNDHAAASLSFLWHHYPSRFSEDPNPFVVKTLKGGTEILFLNIPRDLIEGQDIGPIASALHDMVSTREKATAFKQRVAVIVDGYDDDPRGLWQIPEARSYFRSLFLELPVRNASVPPGR